MKCIYCGGEVLVQPGSSIGICTSCMAENPLPKKEEIKELYGKAGAALRESRFDEAKELFQELLIENPDDAAVCWGFALSEYGIEYVTDPATGEQLPTLHRLSMQKFSEYLYVKKAIDLSWNSLDRDFYIKQSELIDSIQARSLSISSQETPVDVFICYKRSEEGEKRTADSRMAADYYRELTRRGYQVFFAEETLKAGEEYEPRIFAALQSAKVMIAFASKREYYEAVWVKNEWSRYAALIKRDLEEKKHTDRLLIPMFQHMKHEELPEALRSMPSYVEMMTSANPKSELLNLVAGHFKRGKAENVSDILREVRGSSLTGRGAASGESAARSGGGLSGGAGSGLEESMEKTRMLATVRLVNKDFEEAEQLFRRALGQPGGEIDPENWLGLMMSVRNIAGKEALASYDTPVDDDEYYQKALACASGEGIRELQKIAANCRENRDWAQKTEKERAQCEAKVRSLIDKKTGAVLDERRKRCEVQKKLLEEKAAEKPGQMVFWLLFLFLGNLFPFIAFYYLNILGKSDGLGAIVFLMLFQPVFYGIVVWRLCTKKQILDTGLIAYAMRLVIAGFAYWAVMLAASFLMSHAGILFLILAAAASVLTVVRLLAAPMKRAKGIREGKSWAAQQREQLPQLMEELVLSLNQEVDEATEDYRRYYTNFDARRREWNQMIRSSVEKKAKQLAAELDACERRTR
ncbi:hypothetical protein B5E77_01230 [Lachnoclostridium sp. An131]|uniref:toll/interleukin-1 receptor domain-containing protein n=1 Tax=Lachnoclostridium sp. An131 TaxID=1965555 RepID=UPI000B37FFE4|nr:toll/interleukin-1 receptor domain-containing protein [Lachnoclostridium sp. An131]OUQ29013.1 hypothetical protein B5E77_01230 [Lachnoclostridium sp. An131]